jgi:hypothetical protein
MLTFFPSYCAIFSFLDPATRPLTRPLTQLKPTIIRNRQKQKTYGAADLNPCWYQASAVAAPAPQTPLKTSKTFTLSELQISST